MMPLVMFTDDEYNYLMRLEKKFKEPDPLFLNLEWNREVVSASSREGFMLYYRNSDIRIDKFSYNKTYRKSIILFRFCATGPHTNPNDEVIQGAHIHLYKEGYGDKCAVDPHVLGFKAPLTKDNVLKQIFQHCNIINTPQIVATLF